MRHAWILLVGLSQTLPAAERPAGVAVPSAAQALDLPFVLHDGRIFVKAQVDDTSGLLMIDTGNPYNFFLNRDFVPLSAGQDVAAGSVASGQAVLVRLHAQRHRIVLPQGETLVLPSVRSGNFGFVGRESRIRFLGFIGLGLFEERRLTIDYWANRIVIDTPQSDEARLAPDRPVTTLHFRLRGHSPVVDPKVGDQVIAAVVDCGAAGSVALSPASLATWQAQGLLVRERSSEQQRIPSAEYGQLSFDLHDLAIEAAPQNEITLGYAFLRHYRSVWNYRDRTITLFRPRRS